MKQLILVLVISLSFQSAFSQTSIKWWNPTTSSFPVIEGQGWHESLAHPYDRLPEKAEESVRKIVWYLSHEAAGLMIRFRSNATDIRVRYTVRRKFDMPHMPATGVSGVDLYALDKDGTWKWSGGKYHFGDTITYHFSSLSNDDVREYYLYLPLYNIVEWLEIGVPDSSKLTPLLARPDKPIVVYGTSIAQGACASRPGMAWTAILGRRLHRPVINLSFSGNGRLEKSVVDLLTELDPKIYIIDCLPNMTRYPDDTISDRLIKTIQTLRKKKPEVPVLIAEAADGNVNSLNIAKDENYDRVNAVALASYSKLKKTGMQDIYYLYAHDIGFNIESTVEGTHPNDYGMILYANAYEKRIRKILHEPIGVSSATRPCKKDDNKR